MKYLLCLILFSFYLTTSISQDCSDIFISELTFGNSITTLSESKSNNYALEIYNSSETTIDLSSYSLILVDQEEQTKSVNLNGLLHSGKTHVIANPDASLQITQVANQLDETFNFDNVVSIQLNSGSKILDKIGNEGVSTPLDEIDLDRLLTDSIYLSELVVNIGSIRGMNIRRSAFSKQGITQYNSVIQILSTWQIYSANQTTNLGVHTCSCLVPMLYFEDVDPTFSIPEASTVEPSNPMGAGLTMPGILKITEMFPAANAGQGIQFTIVNKPHKYNTPMAAPATMPIDYGAVATPSVLNSWDWEITSFDMNGYQINPWFVFGDNDDTEGIEGTAFEVENFTGGTTGVSLDTQRNFWEVLIYETEPMTSVSDLGSVSNVRVYPTIFEGSITIEKFNTPGKSNKLKRIEIYNMSGVSCFSNSSDVLYQEKFELDLSQIDTRGYYLLHFVFEKGNITKRIFKL